MGRSTIDTCFSRRFVKYLKDHGVRIEPATGRNGHARMVTESGQTVALLSTTAPEAQATYRHGIRAGIRAGILPPEAKRLRFP